MKKISKGVIFLMCCTPSVYAVFCPPTGSYTQSCKEISCGGAILTATCRTSEPPVPTPDGDSYVTKNSSLDMNTCSPTSTVSNNNGTLTCDTLRAPKPMNAAPRGRD